MVIKMYHVANKVTLMTVHCILHVNLLLGCFVNLLIEIHCLEDTNSKHCHILKIILQYTGDAMFINSTSLKINLCNNISSKSKKITCGVPQGSVLGTLLFLLHINDLPSISNDLSFHLFADDTNIFFEASNLDTLQSTVNREMGKVVNWLNPKPVKPVTLIINRQSIEQKDHVKYLGILIDSKLSFKQHITFITKKISQAIGLLSLGPMSQKMY